jgi:NAD(P)-dependent dehydrogenase (short-subunit alcohol dehydrogenase family)
MADPTSGYAFPGVSNLHNDIYPSINPSITESLHQPGKVVLITGAGRGIGRATALQYAHARVSCIILCARTSEQLDEVSRAIGNINSEIKVIKSSIDVSNEVAVKKLAKEVSESIGRLDILVNNAGAAEPWVPISDSKPAEWWNTFEVNLKGPYLFLNAFLPLLVSTAAKEKTTVDVVNMASIGAHVVRASASAYQTTKLALCRLTEFVHVEYGDQGVNAVAVNPGGVPTQLATGIEVIRPCTSHAATHVERLSTLTILNLVLNDTPELSGGFLVWLTAGARTWLGGRYVAAPWDVDVLEKMKDEIVSGDKLKVKLVI